MSSFISLGFGQGYTLRFRGFTLQCNEHRIRTRRAFATVLRQPPTVNVHIIGNYGIKGSNPGGGRLALRSAQYVRFRVWEPDEKGIAGPANKSGQDGLQ